MTGKEDTTGGVIFPQTLLLHMYNSSTTVVVAVGQYLALAAVILDSSNIQRLIQNIQC